MNKKEGILYKELLRPLQLPMKLVLWLNVQKRALSIPDNDRTDLTHRVIVADDTGL